MSITKDIVPQVGMIVRHIASIIRPYELIIESIHNYSCIGIDCGGYGKMNLDFPHIWLSDGWISMDTFWENYDLISSPIKDLTKVSRLELINVD